MPLNSFNPIRDNELMHFIVASIVKKILSSCEGKMEYRRLRWVACSRTSLTKREANRLLLLLKKEGLIATTKPQANGERRIWLTEEGRQFLLENSHSRVKK
jgi:predicted transcriptional regulator